MSDGCEPRVAVSPEFFLRLQELKAALMRLDVMEKRFKNHPKTQEVLTAIAQAVGALPPARTPREVMIHDNLMRLLRGEATGPPSSSDDTQSAA